MVLYFLITSSYNSKFVLTGFLLNEKRVVSSPTEK